MITTTYVSHIDAITQTVRTDAFDVMQAGLNEIFAQSQSHVPVDDGELISNGQTSRKLTKHTYTGIVSYGNDPVSKEYAVIQHENPYYNHTNGTYKFLENAFNAVAPSILNELQGVLP